MTRKSRERPLGELTRMVRLRPGGSDTWQLAASSRYPLGIELGFLNQMIACAAAEGGGEGGDRRRGGDRSGEESPRARRAGEGEGRWRDLGVELHVPPLPPAVDRARVDGLLLDVTRLDRQPRAALAQVREQRAHLVLGVLAAIHRVQGVGHVGAAVGACVGGAPLGVLRARNARRQLGPVASAAATPRTSPLVLGTSPLSFFERLGLSFCFAL